MSKIITLAATIAAASLFTNAAQAQCPGGRCPTTVGYTYAQPTYNFTNNYQVYARPAAAPMQVQAPTAAPVQAYNSYYYAPGQTPAVAAPRAAAPVAYYYPQQQQAGYYYTGSSCAGGQCYRR